MVDDFNASAGGNDGTQEFDASNLPDFKSLAENAENATPEEIVAAAQAAQTLLAQRNHWHQKATRPPKVDQPAPKAPQAGGDDDLRSIVESLKDESEKRRFGYAHGLDPEETDYAFGFAKGNGLAPDKVLEHPFFKAGLESHRKTKRNNDAIPGPSSRAPTIEGKTFGEMPKDDKAKNFSKVVAAIRQRR